MVRFFHGLAVSVVAGQLAGPVFADLTADQVWQDWRNQMTANGVPLLAIERRVGNTLTISEMAFDLEIKDRGKALGKVTGDMPDITMRENSDGSVLVTMGDAPANFAFEILPGDDPDIRLNFTMAQPGLAMNVSGSPDDITYSYSADEFVFTLDELSIDGDDLLADTIAFSLSLDEPRSVSTHKITDNRSISQVFEAGALHLIARISDPDLGGAVQVNIRADETKMESVNEQPLGVLPDDFDVLLRDGFRAEGMLGFVGLSSDMIVREAGNDPLVMESKSTAQRAEYALLMSGQEGLRFTGGTQGIETNMTIPDLPFPISYTMKSGGVRIAMPLLKSEESQEFAFGFDLSDIELADVLWNLFDPSEQLPRTPVTFQLDLQGMGQLLVDYLAGDELDQALYRNEMPVTVETMQMSNLLIKFAGARLLGDGRLEVDNSGFVPAPEGEMNLQLTGGNALLDKLVAMGVLPAEQAGLARMMAGLFARPGAGADTLTSTISIDKKGHIRANGQRIQ